MTIVRRVFVYIVLMTALFAYLDWWPIHRAWWSNGQWPLLVDFSTWARVRAWAGTLLCPPCAALAENFYYALMEVEAGEEEQYDILLSHARYSENPLLPDVAYGARYWWGQGEGRPWRPVSMLAWYLYWLPRTVLWWWLIAGDLFRGRRPWWLRVKRWKPSLS